MTEKHENEFHEAVMAAFRALVDSKGLHVVLLRVEPHVSYTDYVLIATGTSDRHVSTLASGLEDALSGFGISAMGKEGADRGHWALMDFGFLVAHVLQKEAREYYQLDSLWPQAEVVARHEGEVPEEWDDDWDDDGEWESGDDGDL